MGMDFLVMSAAMKMEIGLLFKGQGAQARAEYC